MRSSALCIVTYSTIKKLCSTNLCEQRLTHIIRINIFHAEVCRFTVYSLCASVKIEPVRYYQEYIIEKENTLSVTDPSKISHYVVIRILPWYRI